MIRSAWPGMDFQTADSGLNPLLASYVGAPYQVRATDPAGYAKDAVGWWQAIGTPNVPAQDASLKDDASSLLDDIKSGAHTLVQSTAFAVLGLLIVLVGLLFLWKS